MIRLGKHVSIAGGLDKAAIRADKIGCNALQIFIKNPRGWKMRSIDEKEINKLRNNIKRFNLNPLVVHSSYLINIASPKNELWEKSLKVLTKEYLRANKIGAQYFVLHPGNHTGSGVKNGIKKITKALNKLLQKVETSNTIILLENTAGAGTVIGSKFDELYDIINNVNNNDLLGVCFDTCHAFAAGYELNSKNGLEKTINIFEEKIGLDKLKIIHINDSKHKLGSKKDEHAHIAKGLIGKKAFINIINHKKLKDIPFILETPQFDGRDEDIDLLWSLRKK